MAGKLLHLSNDGSFPWRGGIGIQRRPENEILEVESKHPSRVQMKLQNADGLETKNEALRRTEKVMIVAVNCGNSLMSVPFHYDSHSGQFKCVTSSWYKFGNLISLGISILSSALQALSLLYSIWNNTFDIHNSVCPFRLLNVILLTIITVYQVNLWQKANQIPELWNSLVDIFNRLPKYSIIQGMDRLCVILSAVGLLTLISVQFLYTCIYFYDCEYHVLAGVFQVCDYETGTGTGGHAHMILYLTVQFLITFPMISITACTAIPILLAERAADTIFQILSPQPCLRPESDSEHFAVTREKCWNIWYRCTTLANTRHHNCFGNVVIPIFLGGVVLVVVVSNYIILRATNFLINIIAVIISTALVLFQILVTQDATKFPELSVNVVRSRGTAHAHASKRAYTRRFLNSCFPFRIYAGHFFYLSKYLVPTLATIVIAKTIDLILA